MTDSYAATQERMPDLERRITDDPGAFRVLTGERPTGSLHLGHLFGTIRERVRLPALGVETFVILADYQVITDRDTAANVGDHVRGAVLDYLAAGLDPERIYSVAVMPWLNDPFFTRGVTPGTLAFLKSPAREKAVILGYTQFPGLPYKKKVFYDMDRTLVQTLENYQAMVQAGVHMGLGTDSGPNGRFPGFNTHEEMYMEVLAGRTPMQAIVSATSDNARWLKDDMIGSIAPGKWADLLVLDKNPLSDIRNTETINSVYIAGNSIPTIWETCRDRPVSACQPRPADLPGMPY